MTKNILGVYFDFFGTLIDSQYVLTNVWSRIAKKLGVEISYYDPRIWEGIRNSWREADKLNKFFADFSEEENFRLNTVVLDAMGVESEGSMEIVKEEFDSEFSTGSTFRLYPGCKETLRQINEQGIKMGIISHASPDLCKPVMKKLEILEFFDIFVLTEDVGYYKLQIEIYEIALDKMNTENPEKILHVGDDLNLDVKMAQKAGMTPILFDPLEQHNLKNIITVREFPDILKHLK